MWHEHKMVKSWPTGIAFADNKPKAVIIKKFISNIVENIAGIGENARYFSHDASKVFFLGEVKIGFVW